MKAVRINGRRTMQKMGRKGGGRDTRDKEIKGKKRKKMIEEEREKGKI